MNINFYSVASLIASVLTARLSNASGIDEEHHKKYPYCGKMQKQNPVGKMQNPVGKMENPGSQSKTAGRVVNSIYAEKDYRWAVLMLRRNLKKNGNILLHYCSGSVITDRLYKEIHMSTSIYTLTYVPVCHHIYLTSKVLNDLIY